MSFKIGKDKVRVLEPFAVFGIIVGIGINIIVPLVATSAKIDGAVKAEITKAIWFVAAICGLIYALVLLRYLFKNGALDRLLYFIMAAIFVVLVVFTFYLP